MKFIALGAADSVGASCYFLQADGLNLLLDCGKGLLRNGSASAGCKSFGPDFTSLVPNVLTTLSQLDAIFISHGHYDHIGYLPEMIHQCPNTPVYATHLTKNLGWYLMMDSNHTPDGSSPEQRIAEETGTLRALDRIQPLHYLQPVRIGPLRVTFYEAGHIPGAAMILIESQHEGSFLYTGDFRRDSSSLTPGYLLPAKLHPDHLLMCGLHAKHPRYADQSGLPDILPEVVRTVFRRAPCLISTRQLTKGIELVSFLTDQMDKGKLPHAPIFVDDRIWMLSERLRENGISAFSEYCRRFPRLRAHDVLPPGIYVGGNGCHRSFDTVITANFSLHADYADCSKLVNTLHPKTVILVHSPNDSSLGHHGDTALETAHPNSAFIYPAVGRQYNL